MYTLCTPLHDTALCWARLLWLQAGRHIRRGSTGSRKHSSCCPRAHNETAAYKIYVKSQLWIKFSSSDVFCEYPSFSFLFANFRPGWDVEIARLCAERPFSPTLALTRPSWHSCQLRLHCRLCSSEADWMFSIEIPSLATSPTSIQSWACSCSVCSFIYSCQLILKEYKSKFQ